MNYLDPDDTIKQDDIRIICNYRTYYKSQFSYHKFVWVFFVTDLLLDFTMCQPLQGQLQH